MRHAPPCIAPRGRYGFAPTRWLARFPASDASQHGRFSIPVLEGIEDTLDAARISAFLCNTADDPVREREHVRSLLARRVDGIIVTGQ
jgi:DNA-binding LacI/PurR family transcriptional regulator